MAEYITLGRAFLCTVAALAVGIYGGIQHQKSKEVYQNPVPVAEAAPAPVASGEPTTPVSAPAPDADSIDSRAADEPAKPAPKDTDPSQKLILDLGAKGKYGTKTYEDGARVKLEGKLMYFVDDRGKRLSPPFNSIELREDGKYDVAWNPCRFIYDAKTNRVVVPADDNKELCDKLWSELTGYDLEAEKEKMSEPSGSDHDQKSEISDIPEKKELTKEEKQKALLADLAAWKKERDEINTLPGEEDCDASDEEDCDASDEEDCDASDEEECVEWEWVCDCE